MSEESTKPRNFIEQIIDADLESGKHKKVVTRFPPEPNGFLHIGHAKSICLNFGLAKQFNGTCHLRFDDTNPEKEDDIYVKSIMEDVKWLGFNWGENLFHASDYFQKLHDFAISLINNGKAYVDELSTEKIREYRGNLKQPGKNSPFRDRPAKESLMLFEKMKNAEFADGSICLRAKIDMNSPNMHMRDPVIYRVKKVDHQRTGSDWCIYPMYDFTHCLSDSLEGITHSCCTLEFEDHRPLYDWVLDNVEAPCHPQQIEFSRLNLEFTIMSKRYLKRLVDENFVDGWDDPRMSTISGMRKRGYLPQSIVKFCEQVGITKKNNVISMSTLEHAVRSDLEVSTPRVFGVLDPLKIVITNWDQDKVEIEAPFHPQDETYGKRNIPFSGEIYIEKDDFKEEANRKFFRLKTGGNVRLKYGYIITCDEVIKDDKGEITELRCTYHKESLGGVTPEGVKKPKGIINWVCAKSAKDIEARIYDRLFTVPNPLADKEKDFVEYINPDSLKTVSAKVEASMANAKPGERMQFERQGYFIVDENSSSEKMIFNRIITLKDTWAKIEEGFKK